MTDERQGCSWALCPNKDSGEDRELLCCGRCKTARYCCKVCQKNHWKVHKYNCVGPEVARHHVEEFTIAAIQRAIDAAKPNDVVKLHVGTYQADGVEELVISKPLKIWGPERVGMTAVILKCNNLVVKGISGNTGDVLLTNFQVSGTVRLRENSDTNITMYSVTVQCPMELAERGTNAMEIGDCKGTVLLLACEMHGGSDTLFISGSPKVHLKGTEIRFARARGIFANVSFVIEDSDVDTCGAYGIKGRAGWIEKGDNDIQPGPWSSFGGAAGGFGF